MASPQPLELPPTERLEEAELIERVRWFIRLRFLAVGGVVAVLVFVQEVFRFPLPYLQLHLINLSILAYNFLFLMFTPRLESSASCNIASGTARLANLQISADILALALLIHFSGGVENPFIFYFIFHMIIASILLSEVASYLQATFATLLMGSILSLEYSNLIRHWRLPIFAGADLHSNKVYLGVVVFVFATTLYLAVFMAGSISRKLRNRTSDLLLANRMLKERDAVKNEYVLKVSHDIRSHLSAIQGCLAPVVGGFTGVVPPTDKEFLVRASDRTEKLLFFVKALLRLSSFRLRRELELSSFSLGDVVRAAASTVEPRATSRSISIAMNLEPELPPIEAEKESIEEVIVDLLANSVKYTPVEGKVSISVRDAGQYVSVEITDTGIGIAPQDLERIFDEFYRAPNAREVESDGTGLGLSIAKQIVERHGGRIWADSPGLGKGSTFFINLPKRHLARSAPGGAVESQK